MSSSKVGRITTRMRQRILDGAMVVIEPPDNLNHAEKVIFSRLVLSRPSYDWQPQDLLRLEKLCRIMALSDKYMDEINDDRGEEAFKRWMQMERLIVVISRQLNLHLMPSHLGSDANDLEEAAAASKAKDEEAGGGLLG